MNIADLVATLEGRDIGFTAMMGLADRRMEGARRSAISMGEAVGALGLGLGTLAAVGLSGAVSKAMQFEKTMSGVGAVSGATAAQMAQLSDLALQLGKDTTFSASEAAQALEELVKGGVGIQDIMGGAAKATLNLAAAGGVQLTDAAEIASNALAMFSLKGKDMAHVADMIAGAANASSISVMDFKFSLASAGAAANTLGFNFDDLSVAIAELGQMGIKGSMAGTTLRSMFLRLSPTTTAAYAEMQKLGIITKSGANQFFDAAGKVKSMADVSQVLQNAMKGLSKEQQTVAEKIIFGTYAINATSILALKGAKGFNDMAAAMGKVSAASVAGQRMNNLAGNMEQLRGSVETLQIEIGLALIPTLTRMVKTATGVVNSILEWTSAHPALTKAIVGATAALAILVGGISVLTFAFSALDVAASPVIAVVAALAAAGFGLYEAWTHNFLGIQNLVQGVATTLAPAFSGMGTAITRLRAGFSAGGLLGAFTSIPAALDAVRAGFGTMLAPIGNWLAQFGLVRTVARDVGRAMQEGFGLAQQAVTRAWTAIQPVLATIGTSATILKNLWQAGGPGAAFQALPTMLGYVGAAFGTLGRQIQTGIASINWSVLKDRIVAFGRDMLAQLGAQTGPLRAQLLAWGTEFVAWVGPAANRLLAEAVRLGSRLLDWIVTASAPIRAQLGIWATAFWDWLGSVMPPLLSSLGAMLGRLGGWIVGTAVPAIRAAIAYWAPIFWGWVQSVVGPLLNQLGALASRFLGWIVDVSTPLRNQMGTWARALIAWIPGAVETFLKQWPGMLDRFLDWIGSAVKQIAPKVGLWAGAFFEWIGPMVPTLLEALAMIPIVILAFIAETVGTLNKKLVQWGLEFIKWIGPQIIPMLGALGHLADKLLDWLLNTAAPKIGDQLGVWAQKFADWVPGAIKQMGDALGDLGHSIDTWLNQEAGQLGNAFFDLGKQAIQGFVNGLKSIPGGIEHAVTSPFVDAYHGVTSFLHIKSPSRLFFDVGANVVAGLVQGIEGNAGRARESMASLARLTTTGLLGGNTTAVGSPIDRTNRGLIDFVSYLRLSANVLDRYVRPVQDVHIRQHEQMITTVAILNTGVLGISTSYVGTYTPAVVTNTLMVSLLELAHLALEIALVAVVAVLAVAAIALALLTGRAGTATDAALALASALKSLVAPNLQIGLTVPDVRPIQQMLDAIKPPSFGAPSAPVGGTGTAPGIPTIPDLPARLVLTAILPRIPAQSTTLVLKAEMPALKPMDDELRLHAILPKLADLGGFATGIVAQIQAKFSATVLTLNINTRAVVESISKQLSTTDLTLSVNTRAVLESISRTFASTAVDIKINTTALTTSITRLFAGLTLNLHATLDTHSVSEQITSLASKVSFAMHVQIDSSSIQKKIQETVSTIKISPLVLSIRIAVTGLGGAGGGSGAGGPGGPLSFLSNLFNNNKLDLNIGGTTTYRFDPSSTVKLDPTSTVRFDPTAILNVKFVSAPAFKFDTSSVLKVSLPNAESLRFDAKSVLKVDVTNAPSVKFDANSTMNVKILSAPTLNVKMAEAVTFNTTTFATSIATAISAAFKNVTIRITGGPGGAGGAGAGQGSGGPDWSKWLGDLIGLAGLLKGVGGAAATAALAAAIEGLTVAVAALAAAVAVLAAQIKGMGGGKGGNIGVRIDPTIDLRGAFSKQITEIQAKPISIKNAFTIEINLVSVISKAATDAQNNGGLLTKLGALAGWLQGKVFDLSLKGGGNPLAGLIVSLAQQVPGVKDVVSALKDAGGKILGFLFSGGGSTAVLASFGTDLAAAIAKSGLVTTITNAISSAKWADAMVGWIGAVPQRLLTVLQGGAKGVKGVKDMIVAAFDGAENWLTGKPVDNIVKGLHDIAGSVKNMLMGGVKAYASVKDEIAAAFAGADKWLTGDPVTNIVKGLSGVAGSIKNMLLGNVRGIASVESEVVAAFAGADQWLITAGESIISGLITGIGNKLVDLKTYITSHVGNALPGWLKAALGSASPSKVAMAIGADFTQGLILGLASQTSGLHAQVQQLASIASGMSTGARAPTFTMHGPGESPTPSYLLPQMPKPNAQAPIIVETRLDGSVLSRSVLDDVVAGQRYRVGLVGEGI